MPSISTKANRFYPSIPGITEDSKTQTNALQIMRENIETHERRNNNYLKSFIRFEELVDLGIINSSGEFVLEISGGATGGTVDKLNDVGDVTVPGPADNDILGYNFSTAEWTAQNAAELNLATLDDLAGVSAPVLQLDDLIDVNTFGSTPYDLLYKRVSDGQWVPTMGALQWDGSDLHFPEGDLHFYEVGLSGPAVRKVGNALQLEAPFGSLIATPNGDILLSPNGQVRVDDVNVIMDINRAVRWNDTITSSKAFVALEEVSSAAAGARTTILIDFEDGTQGGSVTSNTGTADDPTFNSGGGTPAFIDAAASIQGVFGANIPTSGGLSYVQVAAGADEHAFNTQTVPVTGRVDYTAHCYWEPQESPGGNRIFEVYDQFGSLGDFSVRYINGVIYFYIGSSGQYIGTTPLTVGVPYHIAITYVAATDDWYLFINGQLELGPITYTLGYRAHNPPMYVRFGNFHACYIDNIEFISGQALWTSSFTPPTVPVSAPVPTFVVGDPAYPTIIDGTFVGLQNTIGLNWKDVDGSDTELLTFINVDPFADVTTDSIPFTGADTDTTYTSPGGNVFAFAGNAEISTDQFFDAPSSVYFDGASSYVYVTDASDFLPGTQDFTIEFMAYNLDTLLGPMMGCYDGTSDRAYRFWLNTNRVCEVNYYTDDAGAATLQGPNFQVVQDAWQHWCLERQDTVISLYLDGVLQDSNVITSGASLNDSSGPFTGWFRIGNVGASINYMNGYVDNLRVTKGTVRYGAPFTPPTVFDATLVSEFVAGDPLYNTRIDGLTTNIRSASTDIDGTLNVDGTLAVGGAVSLADNLTAAGNIIGAAIATNADLGGTATLKSSQPSLNFQETDAPVNEANWMFMMSGGNFQIRQYDDAWTGFNIPMEIVRNGNVSTDINWLATTHQFTGTVNFQSSTYHNGGDVTFLSPDLTNYMTMGLGNDGIFDFFDIVGVAGFNFEAPIDVTGTVTTSGLNIFGDTLTATPPTTENNWAQVLFYDADGSDLLGEIGFGRFGFGPSHDININNHYNSGRIILRADDAGNLQSTLLVASPITGVALYHPVGGIVLQTTAEGVEVDELTVTEKINVAIVTVITTTYTAGAEHVILVDDDTAAAAVTITLPLAATANTIYHIKKLGTTATVTIDANGAETIDGELTVALTTQYESVMLVSDGTSWSII